MKKTKIFSAVLALAMVMVMLVGCGSKPTNDDGPDAAASNLTDYINTPDSYERTEGSNIVVHKASGRQIDLTNLKVACVHKTTGYYWFDCANLAGKEWEAKQNGNCTWTYYAPADFDAASQMSCLMDVLATDPDVLICCPTAGEAVNEALAEAKLKGTLVIIIEGDDYMTNADYLLEPFEAAPFVKAYVDELVAALGDDFTYCLMVGKLTTPFQVKWCNAFYDYATATYPNLKSMTERGAWLEHNDSDDTAAEVTKQVILGHPEVSVIWSSSAGGTEGMCRAINEMGVGDTVHGAGHACPGGAKYAMENGSMLMSSIHYPGDPFAAAAELGRKVIAGETLVPGMDYEGYETLKFDGKWVYGNSWHRLTLDTVDTYIAKWPEL